MWNDDPLGNGFADEDTTPSWPSTPHPQSPIPNLRRAGDAPSAPDKDRLGSPQFVDRQPQIYGAPEPGLISPRENTGANGAKYEKPEPYLNVRITGLDRNRRDILVRFDAQTNLSNFTGTTYRNVSRSYLEFQQFYDAIAHNNPQTLVPALPLAQTSAPSDDEDDRLVRIMLQRWIVRVCTDPILLHDEELRSFIESDFGYQPTPRPRRKTGSGFGFGRRQVPDEDEELQRARFELTKLEGQFFEAAKALDRVSNARKALANAHAEMGNKLINVATTELHPPIALAFRKLGRTWHSLSDLDQAQAISECVILSDSLGYQGLNARAAKETLLQRTGVLEEYQAAVKHAISKRRQIERLKASSNIRADRVDEALEELEEANKYESMLARRAEGISQNLHVALQRHNRQVTDDVTAALIEHSRSTLMYDRQLLRELEALRPDIANADNFKVDPNATKNPPRPVNVPKLEDHVPVAHRPRPTTPPPTRKYVPPPQPQTYVPPLPVAATQPPVPQPPLAPAQAPLGVPQPPAPGPPGPRLPSYVQPPNGAVPGAPRLPSYVQQQYQAQQTPQRPSLTTALSGRTGVAQGPLPPQSPGAGSSKSPVGPPQGQAHPFAADPLGAPTSATTASPSLPPTPAPPTLAPAPRTEPPLGGRFVDGTKSMFVTRPAVSSVDPLSGRATPVSSAGGDPLSRPTSSAGLPPTPSSAVDPLGVGRLSASVRVTPTRSRLDAREAASKLANMF